MALERLNKCRDILMEAKKNYLDLPLEKRRLTEQKNKLAHDLERRMVVFDYGLKVVGGRVNLGTNPRKINWDAMPQGISACFRSEFWFQPKDITGFYISTSESKSGGFLVMMTLERSGRWWSEIGAGPIIRDDFVGGQSYFECISTGQPQEANEGMHFLRNSLDNPGGKMDAGLRPIVHNINELKLASEILNFASGEIERQLT